MKGPMTYPKDHQFGMRVPKGGSNCAKCEYVSKDQKKCSNQYFVKWNQSNVLPLAADVYCCDEFHTAKEQPGQRFESVRDSQEKG